jgi:hypothetical protein
VPIKSVKPDDHLSSPLLSFIIITTRTDKNQSIPVPVSYLNRVGKPIDDLCSPLFIGIITTRTDKNQSIPVPYLNLVGINHLCSPLFIGIITTRTDQNQSIPLPYLNLVGRPIYHLSSPS